jgi:hypothetical protein
LQSNGLEVSERIAAACGKASGDPRLPDMHAARDALLGTA